MARPSTNVVAEDGASITDRAARLLRPRPRLAAAKCDAATSFPAASRASANNLENARVLGGNLVARRNATHVKSA